MSQLGNRLSDSFVAGLSRMLRDYMRGLLGGRPAERVQRDRRPQSLPNIVGVLLEELDNVGTAEAAILELEETNEVQFVRLLGRPTGGTFTIAFADTETAAAHVTAPIAWDATDEQFRDALTALPNLQSGDILVGKIPGAWIVTFGGRFDDAEVQLMTADGRGLLSPVGIPVDVEVINESWADTGTTAQVRMPIPVDLPTPAVPGAMVACFGVPGAGYIVVALECRHLDLGYGS